MGFNSGFKGLNTGMKNLKKTFSLYMNIKSCSNAIKKCPLFSNQLLLLLYSIIIRHKAGFSLRLWECFEVIHCILNCPIHSSTQNVNSATQQFYILKETLPDDCT